MSLEVIIPAYNEEKRIGGVIKPLSSSELIEKILVVNDGSTDKTAQIAADAGADLILNHSSNMGKGAALQTGIKEVKEENFLIIDADLHNLTEKHIELMLSSFQRNPEIVMVNGIIKKEVPIQADIQKYITGIRLIDKKVWKQVEKEEIKGYGIDLLIYEKAKKLGEVKTKTLPGLKHTNKMDKNGLIRGFLKHLGMFIEIIYKTTIRKTKTATRKVKSFFSF